ncbi:DEAD/DEAH box helicase [Natranaerovirga pectinivora]|nr:DEAD/DEAH box helicase [Natranaerovirga pectinivora]
MKKNSFQEYNLSDEILKSIDILNFKDPTKVQEEVIPTILEKKDIVVKSHTGSGKTAAFAIPICELIDWEENKPQGLVIAPTRELAEQIKEDVFNIGRFKRIKVNAIYGKSPFHIQEKALKQKTHVVVGTPGRIIDHIERGTIDLSQIKYLVIDEADKMLEMGFVEQLETIINHLSKERVTMLLSATMPKEIEVLCNNYLNNPIYTEVEDVNPSVDRIVQEVYEINQDEKLQRLKDIIIIENPDSCIVFCNMKIDVDEVHNGLKKGHYTCEKIHGGMEQQDRIRVMNDFRQGYFRYLIATDVAARGIDIDSISLVINYDIPRDKENYIHRIGRTGRINKEGKAITFVTEREKRYLNDIEAYMGKKLIKKEIPDSETVNEYMEAFEEKISKRPQVKELKGKALNKEITKIHINAGKKTKMRPVDIVGTISNIDGVTAEDIGIINIEDRSTFVEILNNKGELVYDALQDKPIKGRLRTVSKKIRR